MGAPVSGGVRTAHAAGPDVGSLLLAESYVTIPGHSLPPWYLDIFCIQKAVKILSYLIIVKIK